MTFEDLGLRQELLKSIHNLGFEKPTPIQEQAIPYLLLDQCDFVGLAQTGTGKTAAFGLPLLHRITSNTKIPKGLVICPTRELCLQISKDLAVFSKYLKTKTIAVYGGTDIKKQITEVKGGCSIIVATPGRLVDLIKRKVVHLEETSFVVLDEADEMLNMGFKEDLDFILETTPEQKNVWLFSATMPNEVARIAKNYMTNPFEVVIGNKNQSNENIEHSYYVTNERNRYEAVKRLIDLNPDIYGLIFCRTKNETANLAAKLAKEGYSSEPLHGDLTQAMRDKAMGRFRNREIQLLIATDVAARGLDIDDITHVINYNLPDDIENYTHRSGRTARAGKKGHSFVLVNSKELFKIKAIERQIQMEFKKGSIPNASEIFEVQMLRLINKTIETEVREEEIEAYLPTIFKEFESFTKEEVIKKFVSAEFNRFIDYYHKSGDLNASDKKGSSREPKERGERSRGTEEGFTRFFVNLGKRDGLNKGGLLRVICDGAGIRSNKIGRIDLSSSFSFFEAENDLAKKILDKVNGTTFEGHRVAVEISGPKPAKKSREKGRGKQERSSRHSRPSKKDSRRLKR